MTRHPLCTLTDVDLGRRDGRRLRDISWTLTSGVTAVLGPSGAGKTSLLNVLVGFERPDRGTCVWQTPRVSTRLPLYWVPADFGLWPHLSVVEHLLGVREEADRTQRVQAASRWLEALDLQALRDTGTTHLSLGERSRLSLARALAAEAEVLVLDEPLAHVDGPGEDRGWAVLRETIQDRGRSVVFSTHDPVVALREADDVVLMDQGGIVATGTPQDLYRRPANPLIARLMGPGTWLSADCWPSWFAEQPFPATADAAGACVRPEQLAIEPVSQGTLRVRRARFAGRYEDVELEETSSGRIQSFLHAPPQPTLQAGMTVVLRWLLLLAVMLGVGCDQPGATLQVTSETTWTMPAEGPRLPAPRAITAIRSGELLALDNAGRVLVFDPRGKLQRHWWMPEWTVGKPERIYQTRDGRLVVADTHYNRVVVFNSDGQLLTMFGREGHGPGEFIYPVAVAEDDDEQLYVCEYGGNDRVQVFDREGNYRREFGKFGTGPGEFQRPGGIVWRDGRIVIADAFNNRIQVFHDDGTPAELPDGAFAVPLHYPYDLAVGPDGHWWTVEYGAGAVVRFDAEGQFVGRYGSTGSGVGEFSQPWGMTVDRDGIVFVADTGNRRIVQLTFAP